MTIIDVHLLSFSFSALFLESKYLTCSINTPFLLDCILETTIAKHTELEEFQTSETDGQLQGRDHWRDTEQVAKMLRAQINLNHMMEDYVGDHHQPATFDMSDV